MIIVGYGAYHESVCVCTRGDTLKLNYYNTFNTCSGAVCLFRRLRVGFENSHKQKVQENNHK